MAGKMRPNNGINSDRGQRAIPFGFQISMFNRNKIHEKEELLLVLSESINGEQGIQFFKSIGLSLDDDFFYLVSVHK